MSKKQSTALSSISLGSQRKTQTPKTPETPAQVTTEPDKPGDGKQKHSFLVTIDKSDHKRLALYALNEETTVQAAMREAVQLFFAEKGI